MDTKLHSITYQIRPTRDGRSVSLHLESLMSSKQQTVSGDAMIGSCSYPKKTNIMLKLLHFPGQRKCKNNQKNIFFLCCVAYKLYTVVPRLVKFVDNLTNWYLRMNRRRLKGDSGLTDCKAAVETLFIVIYSMVKVMVSQLSFFSLFSGFQFVCM